MKRVWYLYYKHCLEKDFKFQIYACNGCHYLLIKSINFNNIVILKLNGVVYHCDTNRISKIEAVSLLQKGKLTKNVSILKISFVYIQNRYKIIKFCANNIQKHQDENPVFIHENITV